MTYSLQMTDTTAIDWGKRPRNLEENLKKCLEAYPYLNDEKYVHKREQLYLMLQQGRTGNFVNAFFRQDSNILSLDLDFLRGMALLTEEAFVLEQFYKKKFSIETAKRILAEYFSEKRYADFPEIDKLLKEQERQKVQFDLQIDFLRKERESIHQYSGELLKKEQEKAAVEQELLRQTLQVQIDKLEVDNMRLRENVEKLERERMSEQEEERQIRREQEQLKQKCQELKRQLDLKEQQEVQDRKEEQESYFQKIFRKRTAEKIRREKENRNKFLIHVISDPRFCREQLEIIVRLAKTGLPLEQLQQICNPDLEITNMEMLETYYNSSIEEGEKISK